MEIKYVDDWVSPTVEMIKCLENIDKSSINEEIGSIDYIVDDGEKSKLIRAMIDENQNSAPAYVDTVRSTLTEIEEQKYKEALIISKRITDSAHDIVSQHDNLDVITPKMKHIFNRIEIISAIEKKTLELCVLKCGKAPEIRNDCKGKKGGTYTCDIRRISDDATFHATMKWKDVLLEDFNHLCEIEKNLKVN